MRASFPFQLELHFIWNGGDVSPRPSRTLKATCFHSSAQGTSCRSWRVQSAVICHPTETYLEPQLFHKGTQHSDQERREVASIVAPHWTSLLWDGSFASRSLFLSIELPLEFCSACHCRKNLLAFSLFFQKKEKKRAPNRHASMAGWALSNWSIWIQQTDSFPQSPLRFCVHLLQPC